MYKQGFFLADIIEEQLPEGDIDEYPDLDERVRDSFIIGTANGKSIVHVIDVNDKMNRLRNDPTFLERSYRHVAIKARQGNIDCQAALDEIMFTSWNPEPGIRKRGKLKDWKGSQRPTKLTDWFPAHVISGVDVEIPNEVEVE